MTYNRFTIKYLESFQRFLIESRGQAINCSSSFASNVINLKNDIKSVWDYSDSAIEVLRNKHESKGQSGLFGIVNDFDLAIRTGFLQGDRVVLLDWIYERILCKRKPDEIDQDQLFVVTKNLVRLLPLAKAGRVVIIPSPFKWNPISKKIIEEVSEQNLLSIPLMSMLNMLSICKDCKISPYTIAESDEHYNQIVDNDINHVESIGRDAGQFAYESILGSLLSERLIDGNVFSFLKNIPLEKYNDVISQHDGFYREYIAALTSGGSLNSEENIEALRSAIITAIDKGNEDIARIARKFSVFSGVGGGAIALVGAMTTISAPLAITGAVFSLSSALGAMLRADQGTESNIISVFKKLSKQ